MDTGGCGCGCCFSVTTGVNVMLVDGLSGSGGGRVGGGGCCCE